MTQDDSTIPSVQEKPPVQLRKSGLPIGSMFADRYEILGRLGQGGMSTVYRARDTQTERVVAIKTLLPHLLGDEDNVKRFRREAQSISTLKHRNIIEVYEYAIAQDEMPYIAMEFMEGEPLSATLKREGRMAYQRAVPILIQVAEALGHAHAKSVVHRDLKPSNVLLRDIGDKKDVVGILDFGLAKFLPTGSVTATSLTSTGEIFGSPPYMSPEQCQGEKIDGRADIYSFGCMMYELLCGRPPLVGETPVATVMKHITQQPQRLTEACPEANIPPALEVICLKALAKEPNMRQQSMIELAEALQQFRSLQAVGMEYKPASVVDKGKLAVARHKKVAIGVGVAALILIGTVVAKINAWIDDREERSNLAIFLLIAATAGGGYVFYIDRKMRRPKVDVISAAAWNEPEAGAITDAATEAMRVSKLADSQCAMGNYKVAEESYANAVELWEAAGHGANRDLAFVKYAHMCTLRFKALELSRDFNAAVLNVEKSFGPGSMQSIAAKNAYSSYLWQRHDYVTALSQRAK